MTGVQTCALPIYERPALRHKQPVSIHSLTQRETGQLVTTILGKRFNPLPHAEGDDTDRRTHNRSDRFQSTPSRRGRRLSVTFFGRFGSFNPLPHAEGDATERNQRSRRQSFNPLPHAEGDKELPPACKLTFWFQSTPSRRGRRAFPGAFREYAGFQSTPSRRGRR